MWTDADGVIRPGVFIRTEHNYDRDEASNASAFVPVGPSMTQQQFAVESDINTIVKRFGLTGELPKDLKVPESGDFTEVTDFQTALNLVIEAERSFAAMPADVRKRFANDPGEFMAFVHNPDNRDEARKLGLLVPEPKPIEPTPVRVIPEPPPAA